MKQTVILDFVKLDAGMSCLSETIAEQIHYCGECKFASKIRFIDNGKKQVLNCGIEKNSELPDSIRYYAQKISARRLACKLFEEK